VRLGVRPEHIRIDAQGSPLKVAVIEPTGSETQVNFKHGEHEIVSLFRDRISAAPDEEMRVSATLTYLFDKASGARIRA